MPTLGTQPEPEHDRDVRDQRKGVPVPDRLAQPRDAVTLGIERRDRLGDESPRQRRPEHDREEPCRDPRAETPPDRREHDADSEERAVGDGLVEGVPTAIAHDRPGHRDADPGRQPDQRQDEQCSRLPEARRGQPTESDEHEHSGEDEDGRAANRKHRADVGAVTGEQRAEEERAREESERDGGGAGRPGGGLRPPIHGEPRYHRPRFVPSGQPGIDACRLTIRLLSPHHRLTTCRETPQAQGFRPLPMRSRS